MKAYAFQSDEITVVVAADGEQAFAISPDGKKILGYQPNSDLMDMAGFIEMGEYPSHMNPEEIRHHYWDVTYPDGRAVIFQKFDPPLETGQFIAAAREMIAWREENIGHSEAASDRQGDVLWKKYQLSGKYEYFVLGRESDRAREMEFADLIDVLEETLRCMQQAQHQPIREIRPRIPRFGGGLHTR